uniref:Trypsin-like n=1 Tax=Callorhinchus milii TaxID=7868 RepID=A0A4W3HP21_CALMI
MAQGNLRASVISSSPVLNLIFSLVFLSSLFWLCVLFLSPAALDDRIIGGYFVTPHAIPYQVSLRGLRGHYCSGTLIHPSWVLSAAHCFRNMEVVAGEHTLYKSGENEQRFRVVRIIVYPYYDPSTFNHDIMLLKLDGSVVLNAFIQPAVMPTTRHIVASYTMCTVSGWGLTSLSSYRLSNVLKAVKVPIVPRYKCNAASSYAGKVTHNMLCAGSRGKDSCQGDSGGPLVCNGILEGIVSWGISCAHYKYPGIYTKVTNYYKANV